MLAQIRRTRTALGLALVLLGGAACAGPAAVSPKPTSASFPPGFWQGHIGQPRPIVGPGTISTIPFSFPTTR